MVVFFFWSWLLSRGRWRGISTPPQKLAVWKSRTHEQTGSPAWSPAWAGLGAGHHPEASGLEIGPGRPGGRPSIGRQELDGPPAWSPAWAGLEAGHPSEATGLEPGQGRSGGRTPTRRRRPGARPRPVWGPASLLKHPVFPVVFPTIRHFSLFVYFLLILEIMLNTSKCCNQTSKQDYRTMSFQYSEFDSKHPYSEELGGELVIPAPQVQRRC